MGCKSTEMASFIRESVFIYVYLWLLELPNALHTDTEVFDFINPLTDKDLAELRWYLESYWSWPSNIDDEHARAVEGNLPKWGKALFDATIKRSSDAMRLFGRFDDDHATGRVLTIDTTEPRILRLPWELLREERTVASIRGERGSTTISSTVRNTGEGKMTSIGINGSNRKAMKAHQQPLLANFSKAQAPTVFWI